MMSLEHEFEMTVALIRADKLNRRQLAIRATNAQANAKRWRSMGAHFNECASGADTVARAHLFLLIEKGAK